MVMKRMSIDEVKQIADEYGLHPCRIKGTNIVNIRKRPSDRTEDIPWPDFERILRQRGLAVYKAENSDFLKIMKNR